MRISRLVIGGFAAILFTFAIGSTQVAKSLAKAAQVAAAPQTSNVLIADGGDPLPRPHKLVV
jgi:hypothetical protein